MSFIRVVITFQPVYKTHISAISIPDPRPSGTISSEGTDDEVEVLQWAESVDIVNFNDYRPSNTSSLCAFVSAQSPFLGPINRR